MLSLSQVLRNFCCHRITFSYGLIYLHKTGNLLNDFEESQAEVLEQREFITSQDPQDLVLFIDLYGLVFLLSMILVCQCFYLILLEELKQSKVEGFALGYLDVVGELGTKPF